MSDSAAPVQIPLTETASDTAVGGVVDAPRGAVVILVDPMEDPRKITIRLVETDTLREIRRFELDRSALTKDFEVAGNEFLLHSCGCRIMFPLWAQPSHWAEPGHVADTSVAPVGHNVQTGLLEFELGSAASSDRYDTPPPQVDGEKFTSMWAMKADIDEGQLSLNWRTDRVEIVLIGPADRSQNVVTRLPAGSVVLVRSATTAYY